MKAYFFAGVLLWAGLSAVAEDWPIWRGATANGISTETGLNVAGARVLWNKELGSGYSSVSVRGDRLYTMGNQDATDVVYCLNALTGEELWRFSEPCELVGGFKGPRATPVLDGTRVYTVNRLGVLSCLDASTGKKEWQLDALKEIGGTDSRWGISTSAVIHGDLVLLNLGGAGCAVNKHSGAIAWKSEGMQSYASPVLFERNGTMLAAIFSAPGLMIVEAESGSVIDQFEWKTKYDINGADPVLVDDAIYLSSAYQRGAVMLDFSTGKLIKRWENLEMRNQFSSAISLDGHLFGVDGHTKRKGFLRCLKASDGTETWSHKIGFGSLISADGMLIVLNEKGTLLFVEATAKEYKEVASFETGLTTLCWTPPALANGVIYCRNHKGTLVAVDVRK